MAAKRDNGQGMFDMPFISTIAGLRSLAEAKQLVSEKIEASTANSDNKERARTLVRQSATVNQLVLGMGNFSLAHMGLKVR